MPVTPVKQLNLQVSRATISRGLKDISIKYEKVKRQISLTPAHIKQREVFCRKYLKQNWSKICFTDEKRWCLDGPDRVGHYWHDLRKEPLRKANDKLVEAH